MANIDLKLSAKVEKITQRSEILIRFFQGQNLDLRVKTGLFIAPRHFRYFINRDATKKKGITVPDKVVSVCKEEAKAKGYSLRTCGEIVIADRIITSEVSYDREQQAKINDLQKIILEEFTKIPKEEANTKWLEDIIFRFHHPKRTTPRGSKTRTKKKKNIYELAEYYLEKKRFSYDHTKAFRVLVRDLARFEAFENKVLHEKFKWDIDQITRQDIENFEEFLRTEKSLSEKYPKQFADILEQYPVEINIVHKSPKLHDRGDNTIIKLKKKFKAFMQWLYEMEYTTNRPFEGIKIGVEKYGIPYYLWKEERNLVADTNLHEAWERLSDEDKKEITKSSIKSLEVQRDIFIFQCLTGCRVGDLYNLTSLNISNGILEYVPSKTSDEDGAVTPRVPLNLCALKIVQKYKGVDPDGRLLPYISEQKYNQAIKKVLILCDITRLVPIRNSTTGEPEIKRICDVASSHMARRTFVGAAYKAVKDPNIVGKMSGHVEGSRAFNRYRQIDDEILKETIREI